MSPATRQGTRPRQPPGHAPARSPAKPELRSLQRARVMAALLAVVAAEGCPGLTVANIVGHARVSRRTFYRLFRDPEDCFLATFDGALTCAEELARSAYASQPGWGEGMAAAVPALLGLAERERGLARLCVVDALCAGERVLERRAQAIAALASALDAGPRLTDVPAELRMLNARTTAGGLLALAHEHLRRHDDAPLADLRGPLLSMIVMPYLGRAAALQELADAASARRRAPAPPSPPRSPLQALDFRVTDRTLRVLAAVRENPGASNREIAQAAGIQDPGQTSKLLRRLQHRQLLVNDSDNRSKAPSNAWLLTPFGAQLARLTADC